jgi:cell division protein FtsQ
MADRRRLAQPLNQPAAGARHRAHALWPHALARCGALLFIGFAIVYGLLAGGHLESEKGPLSELSARFAHAIGFSAEQVRITGLERHRPEQVLAAIGVKLGGSLIGFDAGRARRMMQNIDWVESASIHRIYPNELDIVVRERRPFAIWQRGGVHYVIDRSGAAISPLEPGEGANHLLVTGEGAQRAAADLVNHLEAHPALLSKVRAASRVGDRRWTLHLASGQRLLLPESGEAEALARFERLEERFGILARAVSEIDLRLEERVVFVPAPVDKPAMSVEGGNHAARLVSLR